MAPTSIHKRFRNVFVQNFEQPIFHFSSTTTMRTALLFALLVLFSIVESKKDWDYCTTSSECDNKCCSSQYSGDGKLKCTPNGTQCVSGGGGGNDGGSGKNWSGVNSYFLWALSESDRKAHLSALRDAGIKVVRIFIVRVNGGTKSTSASFTPDLEDIKVGNYQDGILNKIDLLMRDCKAYGIKLNLVMHDRYSLGVWQKDGYVAKYGSAEKFYTSSDAQRDYDKRIQHVLQHRNPYLGNTTWGQLTDVVWAFGIQNEGRGHMQNFKQPWTWHCNRAKAMRPMINKKIYITTGGGADFSDSLQDAHFQCPDIDVIGLHNYGTSSDDVRKNVNTGISKAKQHGKKIIYEEYGAEGNNKAKVIGDQADVCNQLGVPFWPWEFVKADQSSYEYWTGSGAWNTHVSKAKAASNPKSAFNWN
eukprot:TRINITY_DN9409_c0_g1_i1.p1 TRINITY_DN9409_c0_g1~~TRINITY_DN9409_c0_g1_i1.p1  ORF type:complete len:417 (+),score=108.99 TRINITY_DN9409_c0_g1_i1:381-1631(+)